MSEVPDDYTSNDTTSTTSFVMLESADSFVRRSMARRGYGSVCGLAILLSSVGHMSPQAASTTSKLPFHRLEAGVLQGDESKSMNFVLFQLPGSEFNDLYLGSFFCNSVSLLQKPLKTSVIASLEKLCSSEREPQEQQPQGTAATSSSVSTTTSLHQLGKQPSTPTRVPEEQDLDPSATASSSSTTTSLHQVGKQPSTPTRVPSVLETWPVSSQVQDEGLKDTGRYGARALSFQFAWDFRQRHDRGRALQAVKECCPAFVTGFVSGSSWEVMVSIAKEQDDTGRLYALVCKAQARRGLLKQLPQATAIATSLVKQGPQMYFIVNDKTLSRIFASLDWHNSPWVSADPEELELCTRTFVHGLCHGPELDGGTHPSTADVQAAVRRHRPAFEGVLKAVRNQTAFVLFSEVAFSLYGAGKMAFTASFSSPPTSVNYPNAVDQDEEQEGDEALREVQNALRPVTENADVAKALAEIDDYRKHENVGRFSLHPQLRREVFKVHRNLNHPAKEVFLRALRHSGVREDILQWIKEHFRCPLCEASKHSLPARPAHLAKALEFNAIIAVDLFYMNLFGSEKVFLLCIDYGTGYVQVTQCADAKALTVRKALSKCWVAAFGVPELLICDQGPEFAGEQFVEYMSQMGAAVHYTDGSSPWKNGRAERAVGTVKRKIKTVVQETSATEEELDLVVSQVVAGHNSLYDRHGYSPNQRLFGRSLRLPGSLMATDKWDQEMIQASAGDLIQRSWAIREAARAAWIKEDDVVSVHRATSALTRRSDEHSFGFKPGQWAYVWRKTDNRYGWVGPGALIAMTPGGNSWWINMRGRLWKVSAEQLRAASPEEDLGAALVTELHRELLEQVREGVRTGYEDVTQEGAPDRAVEEIFPEVFGDAEMEYSPSEISHGGPDLPEPPAEHRDEVTTTAGEAESERVAITEVDMSRRQSVQSGVTSEPASASTALPGERPIIRVDEASNGSLLLGPVRERRSNPVHQPYYAKSAFLEEEIKPSTYLEVFQFDETGPTNFNYASSAGPRWLRLHTSGRRHLEPLDTKSSFKACDAEASFCVRDRCMYMTKSKVSFGQVEFSKLQGEEREREVSWSPQERG